MKFFAGFMTGIVFTLIGVLFWLKKEVPPVEEAALAPTENYSTTPSAEFETFYQRFHEDSLFQIEHISFPLLGIPANADSIDLANNDFRWKKEAWIMHRPFDAMEGQFQKAQVAYGEDMVIEEIKGVQGQYGMQRRFSKTSEGWQLIYYAGMNKLATPQ